jgi:aspartyl-tRNA(Asn)/glutamyl-tRNA(Gln) amidotransferase subunit A
MRSEWADADEPIGRACDAALKALEAEGAVLVDVSLPLARLAPAMGAIIIASESAANTADDQVAHANELSEELRTIYGLMGNITAQELLMARRTRVALRRQTAAAIAGVDVLALPATARQAQPYALDEGRTPLLDSAATAAMTRFAWLGNLTGLPGVTFPVALYDGLPISLQIMSDAWDEASVIAVCAHAERMELTHIERPSAWRSLKG